MSMLTIKVSSNDFLTAENQLVTIGINYNYRNNLPKYWYERMKEKIKKEMKIFIEMTSL